MIRDRDTMGVARKIVQNMFRTAEWRLGVDDPVLSEKLPKKPAETAWLGEVLERSMELESVLPEELSKSSGELAAEDAAQYADGQKETVRRSDPLGAIGGKAAGRNDVMDVGMMLKVLAPGMEHAKKPDLCSQMLRVAGEFEQRRCAASEEQIVKQPLVLQDKSREFMRQGEYDVEVRNWQQFSRSLSHPSGACVPLAPWTVPVPARVVRDGLMAAARALITMAAQGRSAASDEGIEHLAMLPCKVWSVVLPESVACCADDVGHLKGRPAHRFFFSLERFTSPAPDTSIASSGLGTACRWRRDKWR